MVPMRVKRSHAAIKQLGWGLADSKHQLRLYSVGYAQPWAHDQGCC